MLVQHVAAGCGKFGFHQIATTASPRALMTADGQIIYPTLLP